MNIDAVSRFRIVVKLFFCFNHLGKERCPVGQWLCPNEKCIDREKVCNGIRDCPSGNDENQSSCDQVYCDSGHFFCSKGKCIPNSKVNRFQFVIRFYLYVFFRNVTVLQIV